MSPAVMELGNQDEAAAWNELRPVLHAEVEMLPDRYRIPVILSYLEGKTNEEVAKLLRWPVGTVKGRLSRARDLLRRRLVRRGLALSATFLMTALSHGTVFAEVVPADLVSRTVCLAARHGSRVALAVPTSSAPPDALEPTLSQHVDRTTGLKGGLLRLKQQTWGRFFLTIVAFLIASGIWIAAPGASGLSSELRTAISKFLPSQHRTAVAKLLPARAAAAVAGEACH